MNVVVEWLFRALGLFLLWTSLTIGPGPTLLGTPVMDQILSQYPSWSIFFYDLLLGMGVLSVVVFLVTLLFYLSKKEHASYKIISRLKKIDNKIIINFLNACYFLTRWLISFALAYVVWQTLVRGLITLVPDMLSLPSYSAQPVIFFIGLLGIASIIGSVHAWKKHIAHLFCIHCKF